MNIFANDDIQRYLLGDIKMSRLNIINRVLRANPEVVIVNVDQQGNLDIALGYSRTEVLTHEVKFAVAPKKGLYTATELQGFMETLKSQIPGKIYSQNNCREPEHPEKDFAFYMKSPETYLRRGVVQYAEIVGNEQRTKDVSRIINITVDDLVDNSKLISDKKMNKKTQQTFQQDYLRRIWIELYPNQELAKQAISAPDALSVLYVSLDQLMPYRKDLRDLASKIKNP